MTNEEKAKKIADLHKITYISGLKNERGTSFIECMNSAYQMAKWKDQQFKEYLEKKRAEILNKVHHLPLHRVELLNEIINELFKED